MSTSDAEQLANALDPQPYRVTLSNGLSVTLPRPATLGQAARVLALVEATRAASGAALLTAYGALLQYLAPRVGLALEQLEDLTIEEVSELVESFLSSVAGATPATGTR